MLNPDLLQLLFACGGDSSAEEKDPPRIDPPKPKPAPRSRRRQDDDDDDDFSDYDYIQDPKDRRIKKLSDEGAKKRNQINALKEQIEQLQEQIQERDATIANAVKLQSKYDKLKADHDGLQMKSREQAIRTALASDKIVDKDGKEHPRAWYDVDMVLSLLDRDTLAVDLSDGTVGGLEDQLNQLAEQKPFLVKAASGEQGSGANTQRPTGSVPQTSAGGTRSQEAQRSEQDLLNDFPALRNVMK